MKTFYSWCAANVGIIGILLAVFVIAITCLFRMEELRYLGYTPLLYWLVSFILFWSEKSNITVPIRFLAVFGGPVCICFAPSLGLYDFNPDTIAMVKSSLWKMALVGAVFALEITVYVYRNFAEVVSRRMLYRNSSVEMFDIRLKYCIHQFLESFLVAAAIVLLLITCIELKPSVEALRAGNNDYWTIQIARFVKAMIN